MHGNTTLQRKIFALRGPAYVLYVHGNVDVIAVAVGVINSIDVNVMPQRNR